MKFLVPNYSYRPQIPVFSVLCPQLNLLNPPEKKFLGTPLYSVSDRRLDPGALRHESVTS